MELRKRSKEKIILPALADPAARSAYLVIYTTGVNIPNSGLLLSFEI